MRYQAVKLSTFAQGALLTLAIATSPESVKAEVDEAWKCGSFFSCGMDGSDYPITLALNTENGAETVRLNKLPEQKHSSKLMALNAIGTGALEKMDFSIAPFLSHPTTGGVITSSKKGKAKLIL